jgi:hypothetical protein
MSPALEVAAVFPTVTSFCARVLGWPTLPASDPDCRLLLRPLDEQGAGGTAQAESDRAPCQATLLSASKSALDLLTDRAFEPGARVELEFPAPANFGPRVLACVVRSLSRDDGKWAVECYLPLPLGPSELSWLGVRRGVPSKTDRRRFPRWPYQKTAFFRRVGEEGAKHYPAKVDDVSFGGARLLVAAPAPEVGASLELLLQRTPSPPLCMLAVVCHARVQPDGNWALGCSFVRELSWNELASVVSPKAAELGVTCGRT